MRRGSGRLAVDWRPLKAFRILHWVRLEGMESFEQMSDVICFVFNGIQNILKEGKSMSS